MKAADYEHYKNGKEIFDECPKELHIKRGRDYDVDYATVNIKQEPILSTICKVKFKGGTYWYAGDYKIGDLVYVEGAKANELGVVIKKKTTSATGHYKILNSIHNIDLFKSDDVEALWNRYKKKDRILYLANIGLDETLTKKQFLSIMEQQWIQFAQKENNWNKFLASIS